MRRPISSKPDTCTESMDVYAAGISRRVARITRGGLFACHALSARQRVEMGEQKSAEAIEHFNFEIVQMLCKDLSAHPCREMLVGWLCQPLNKHFKRKEL